jgi:mono/diheme cytochrome c family protein
MRMLKHLILGALCLLAAASAAQAFMAGNPKAGETFAAAHCLACHAPAQAAAADMPDFTAIAADPDTYPLEALRKSLKAPHWPADVPDLTSKDADNLIAYILSLRPE